MPICFVFTHLQCWFDSGGKQLSSEFCTWSQIVLQGPTTTTLQKATPSIQPLLFYQFYKRDRFINWSWRWCIFIVYSIYFEYSLLVDFIWLLVSPHRHSTPSKTEANFPRLACNICLAEYVGVLVYKANVETIAHSVHFTHPPTPPTLHCCLHLNSNGAPSNPHSKPALPVLCVLPSVFKGDETEPGTIFRKGVADLKMIQNYNTCCRIEQKGSVWRRFQVTSFHEQSSHSGSSVTGSGLNSCRTTWFSSSRHAVIW